MDDRDYDINDVLDALARFLRAQINGGPFQAITPIVYDPSTPPAAKVLRNLFCNQVSEADASDPYTVLRIYGGPPQTYASFIGRINVQVETVGTEDRPTLLHNQAFYGAVQDPDGRPLRMKTIAAGQVDPRLIATNTSVNYLLTSIKPLQRPGLIGRDIQRGRGKAVWNFEVAFERVVTVS